MKNNEEMKYHKAYLGIGSNLGDRMENLRSSLRLIDETNHSKVVRTSPVYETEPYGDVEQDNFLNAVVEIETQLSPGQLMDTLLSIEAELKRERIIHWGPRTIDLDILFYDDLVSSDPHITLPHPGVHERLFVLVPLCDIASDLRHPVLGESCSELVRKIEGQEQPLCYNHNSWY